MKATLILFLLIFSAACNDNSVSEEERKAIKEGIRQRKPVKVSEEEIITKAFEEARKDLNDTAVTVYPWKEFYVRPADSMYSELWLAYEYGVAQKIKVADNVQLNNDEIIYSKPIVRNDTLQSMLIAIIPRKDIILKLSDQ